MHYFIHVNMLCEFCILLLYSGKKDDSVDSVVLFTQENVKAACNLYVSNVSF